VRTTKKIKQSYLAIPYLIAEARIRDLHSLLVNHLREQTISAKQAYALWSATPEIKIRFWIYPQTYTRLQVESEQKPIHLEIHWYTSSTQQVNESSI
jgi:hypothetical protein